MRKILLSLPLLICFLSGYGQNNNIRFEYTGLSNHARPALIIEKEYVPTSEDFPMATNEWGRKNSKTKLPEHCVLVSPRVYKLITRYAHKNSKRSGVQQDASLTISITTDGTDKKLNALDREATDVYIAQLEQLLTKKKLDNNELKRIVGALEEMK